MKKDHCLTKGTYQPGLSGESCTRSLTHHVPSLTTEIQTSYITTTVQLNSVKFSLGECSRYAFKTKHIRWCLAGRTSLIQTIRAPREVLVTSPPLMITGPSAGPALLGRAGWCPDCKGTATPGWARLGSCLPPKAALLFPLPGTNVLLSGKHYWLGEQGGEIKQ